MLFVLVGLVLIGLNLADVGPFGRWNWEFFGDLWKFCVPFVLAIIWWVYSDKSGLNKRREMQRMEDKKKAAAQENLEALGMDARAPQGRKAAALIPGRAARPPPPQSPSSTAPRLAVEAFFANFASTPRV
jgi:small Trp-rich protein